MTSKKFMTENERERKLEERRRKHLLKTSAEYYAKIESSVGYVRFSVLDMRRIRRLLLMGIIIKLRKKDRFRYKTWISGYPHLWTTGTTAIQSYRRMFKRLKSAGVYLP